MESKVFNIDCLEYMKTLPDKYFDLCIADPPYGIGIAKNPFRQKHSRKEWDNNIPTQEYFDEILRISKYAIIFSHLILVLQCVNTLGVI